MIGGRVAPGYEPVAAAFARTLADPRELGAAFAAVRDGALVVDLWGGVADRQRELAWEEGTLQPIFSGTKALVAVCLLMLVDAGTLDLDAPVAGYWPEFAAAGKERVRVREVVSHTAALAGLTAPVSMTELLDDRGMARRLAAQPQLADPRAPDTYHALTYGWLCGELLRRIDGRSIGRFFADEVARPLGLELWIGLPERHAPRVARLELDAAWGGAGVFAPSADPLVRAVWGNPPVFGRDTFAFNDRALQAAELPGAGAIGTARAVATLFGSLDRILSPAARALGATPIARRHEPLLDEPQCFGAGFQLQTAARRLGPPADAFGHAGAGGSIHGAWPGERIGFSYAMNFLRDDPGDDRAAGLLAALSACAPVRSPIPMR